MNAGDGTRAVVVLVHGDTETVIGRIVGGGGGDDLTLIDALARVQVVARRRGCAVRLRVVCPTLLQLLELVGLTELMASPPGSPLDARGEAEGGEELGVEEMVEPGDPSP